MENKEPSRPHPTSIDHGLWKLCNSVRFEDEFPIKTIKGIEQYGAFLLLEKWDELKNTPQGRTAFKNLVETIEGKMTDRKLIDENSRELKSE